MIISHEKYTQKSKPVIRKRLLATSAIALFCQLSAAAHAQDAPSSITAGGFVFIIENETYVSPSPVINENYDNLFHVGIIDLTLGSDTAFTETYVNGRAAFYLTGMVKGEYLITASADTGDGPIAEMFRNLDAKSVHALLDRIDPDDFYPVYGDGSSFEDNAPTNGKLYVRIEREDSSLMWGLFDTSIAGSHFIRSERSLYGAEAEYHSDEVTTNGAIRTESVTYAAQPETAPQRDILRGTGGSAYFLKRQDIMVGSETLSVVTRDPETGRILNSNVLEYGEDYKIDYNQGVVILSHPLNSTSTTFGVVRTGALGDDTVSLDVQYEYTPTLVDIDGFAYGIRVQHWATDTVRIGGTAMRENSGVADQNAYGADAFVKLGENSYVEAEYAQTQGAGFGSSFSSDGGLTFSDIGSAGTATVGSSYRVKLHADLSEVLNPSVEGSIGGYYEQMGAGFSAISREITTSQNSWGVYGSYQASEALSVGFIYDDYFDGLGNTHKESEVTVGYDVSDRVVVEVGIQQLDRIAVDNPLSTGARTDTAIRLSYFGESGFSTYVFGQATVSVNGGLSRNDRYGLGGSFQVSEKVSINGELSSGTSGVAAQAMLEYRPNDGDLYYFGYRLAQDHASNGFSLSNAENGSIVAGAKRTYSESLSGFFENSYDLFGSRKSSINTYGVEYAPNDRWAYSGGLELGRVRDDVSGAFDRTAFSTTVNYNNSEISWARLRFEGRWEDGDGLAQDRTTFLLSASAQHQVSEDWVLIGTWDEVVSRSDQSALLDGEYIEGSIGYAYRPVSNDRLNVLLKYTYLYDMPGADQVSVSGSTDGPKQQSTIFSVDTAYDISETLSIGAKYGYRVAAVADRGSNDFTTNTAHLGVLRADFHIVNEWDGMIEGRALINEEADILETGASVALYRHFGDAYKAGLGYHFGNVNSDLRNIDKSESGVFFNLIAKF